MDWHNLGTADGSGVSGPFHPLEKSARFFGRFRQSKPAQIEGLFAVAANNPNDVAW
jgi:hypothetical protein